MVLTVDEKWMRVALDEARLAFEAGEVPVGAVIVRDDEMLARAHNLCETRGLATAHAEMLAIEDASRRMGGWRLSDATLYVTLEPCPMCTGALINARIGRIIYAAKDARAGACGSLLNLPAYPLEARPLCEGGVLAEESQQLLRSFFAQKRRSHG